ncbi:hypothetical protein [Tuberibacillus sp. Marseille-P3662]|uniref:hypothetical protein n=1 Tax=Tuberibacillus sp. Marseille-P3662 TaxID=1965358 RepID=UPI00159369F5|nr:hypothetical protein [Tuberibacillus sp. Marseille-P3662]
MELRNINIDERMAHYNVTGLSMGLVNHGQMPFKLSMNQRAISNIPMRVFVLSNN